MISNLICHKHADTSAGNRYAPVHPNCMHVEQKIIFISFSFGFVSLSLSFPSAFLSFPFLLAVHSGSVE